MSTRVELSSPMEDLVLNTTELLPGREWWVREGGYCFLLLQRGRAVLLVEAATHPLRAGDAAVLKLGPPAALRAGPEAGCLVHYFHFLPRTLNGLLNLGERELLEMAAPARGENASFYPAGSSLAQLFGTLVERPATPGTLAHSCQMLQLVAAMLSEKVARVRAVRAEGDVAKERLITVLSRLPEGELQVLSVEEVARRCGCSRRHLGRVFHEHFGHSVAAHKMELRLQQAARILLTSKAKIIDVAFECGFGHLGQFSARFRKRYGATPARWRQQARAAELGLERPAARLVRPGSPPRGWQG